MERRALKLRFPERRALELRPIERRALKLRAQSYAPWSCALSSDAP